MRPLRIAVVGGGRLGSIHARLLGSTPDAVLVAIVEPNAEARERLGREHQVPTFDHLEPLWGQIDAAIVAAPTALHERLGLELLQHGAHVLMEKPLASTSAAALRLCEQARAERRVLQAGHVERFNPALRAVSEHVKKPRFMLAERCSGFTFRSTDVGVILDLMIHDIDIVLHLHGGEVVEARATAAAVLGPHEDWAHAQLVFDDGCLASLTASRVERIGRRQLRVASDRAWAELDYSKPEARLTLPSQAILDGQCRVDQLGPEDLEDLRTRLMTEHLREVQPTLEPVNAILEEQRDFVRAIRDGSTPLVSGQDGFRAVQIADRLLALIRDSAAAQSPRVLGWPHPWWTPDRRAG